MAMPLLVTRVGTSMPCQFQITYSHLTELAPDNTGRTRDTLQPRIPESLKTLPWDSLSSAGNGLPFEFALKSIFCVSQRLLLCEV